MNFRQALNGDWVDVKKATSFNVADFGKRVVVFARIGNVSYELYETTTGHKAEEFLAELKHELETTVDNTWTINLKGSDELRELMVQLSKSGQMFEVVGEPVVIDLPDNLPKKRTPRKKVDPDA